MKSKDYLRKKKKKNSRVSVSCKNITNSGKRDTCVAQWLVHLHLMAKVSGLNLVGCVPVIHAVEMSMWPASGVEEGTAVRHDADHFIF